MSIWGHSASLRHKHSMVVMCQGLNWDCLPVCPGYLFLDRDEDQDEDKDEDDEDRELGKSDEVWR